MEKNLKYYSPTVYVLCSLFLYYIIRKGEERKRKKLTHSRASETSVPTTTMTLLMRLLCFIMLLLTSAIAQQSPILMYDFCGNSTTGGKNLSASFETNLKNLLSWIVSDSDTSGGYNNTKISTNSNDDDAVYGFYECRGDITGYFCQFCVNTAIQALSQRCPNGVSAVIWYDSCIIRYSNESFVGKVSVNPAWNSTGTENIKDPNELQQGLDSMRSLVTKAVEAKELWDYSEFNWSDGEKRYGVAQCGRDLDSGSCRECLDKLLDMVPECCGTKETWAIMAPSCGMKFDDKRFYEVNGQPGSSSPTSSPVKQGGSNHSKTITIIIVSVLVAVAILICCGYYFWDKIQLFKDGLSFQDIPLAFHDHAQREDSLNSDLPTIPLIVIQQTTNYFSHSSKLGEGGFGPVYKGTLPDGTEIAVKRLSETSSQGLEEFKNEVIFIAKLQHRNLVRLVGCCIEENEKLLVYEFMPNSSLDFHLFNEERRKRLDWNLRLSIINGIARGLLYLHEDSRLRVIHRDLKASNVLLDHEMNPKISDFGLARTFEKANIQTKTKRVIGTYGYMAPEYAMAGLFSVKSDVFSFGVLLLEIICGKRNSEFHLSEHGQSLLLYSWKLWCEGRGLELTDPVQKNSYNASEIMKCIHIGLLCVQEDAADRPTMSTVALMLGSDTMTLPEPRQPAFSVGRMHSEDEYTSKYSKDNSVNEVTVTNVAPR